MAIKMRILYSTGKGKLINMANILKQEFNLAQNTVDKIPPAYSCDKERLLVLIMTLKGDLESQVRLFCQEINKTRALNTALVIDGKPADAEKLVEILKTAGTNVIENIHYVKGGLPFLKGVSDEEKAALIGWTNDVIKTING